MQDKITGHCELEIASGEEFRRDELEVDFGDVGQLLADAAEDLEVEVPRLVHVRRVLALLVPLRIEKLSRSIQMRAYEHFAYGQNKKSIEGTGYLAPFERFRKIPAVLLQESDLTRRIRSLCT